MGKDCLKLTADSKRLSKWILVGGIGISTILGILAYNEAGFKEAVLKRPGAGEGAYEQELIAWVEGEESQPLTVVVEEEQLTQEEAEILLQQAAEFLDENFQGEKKTVDFVETIPGMPVEVDWISTASEYFHADGSLREDVKILEPVEVKVQAVLSCQSYTREYETMIVLQPGTVSLASELLECVEQAERTGTHLKLPTEHAGRSITWKRPMDYTFIYVLLLSLGTVVFLRLGEKRDQRMKQEERLRQMEQDYPQVISKFTMLLSAGLSVRNAWERIVKLYRKKSATEKEIYEEMSRSLLEFEKGIPELQVYELFSNRVGQIHYKKLMALFISDRRKGSVNLLEVMEQEMLLAWEEQKRNTRKQGEQIGTKLLLPMMGMLFVVFLMILVPAFMSFQL